MPLNERKIISIILEECDGIEERCNGYREEVREVITDILMHERGHRVSRTHIQKKVNDRCNAAARFLIRERDLDMSMEEGLES